MRFENADEAERFWNAQKAHVESMSDLRWFVGEENKETRALIETARTEIKGIDYRVQTLERAASDAAKTAGHIAGRSSGAKWAAAILALFEMFKMVASALGHPLQ